MCRILIVISFILLVGCGDTSRQQPELHSPLPTLTPGPQIYTGQGDATIDISRSPSPALVEITGNEAGKLFVVDGRDTYDLPVPLAWSFREPYHSQRILNYAATRINSVTIKSVGGWRLAITGDLSVLPDLIKLRTITHSGDSALQLGEGEPCDLLDIVGNDEGKLFGIRGYTPERQILIVNSLEKVHLSVPLPKEADLLQISATGKWSIKCTP